MAPLKYLAFVKNTGLGAQTVPGVGFRGKALLLWTTWQTAHDVTTGAMLTLGMTDGVLQSTRFIGHPGGETATTSAQAEQTNAILFKSQPTSGAAPPIQVRGVFSAFNADGFTIDWTANDGGAQIIHALVIGGSIEARFKQVKITVGAGADQVVTGVGFRPSSFIVMGGAADEFGAGDYNLGGPFGSMHGFGFSNATENVCSWTLGRGTGGAADNYRGQHTTRVSSVRVANLSGAGEMMGGRITTVSDDGFTFRRDVSTGSQPVQHVLCLRGVRAALGSFTTPSSPANVPLALSFKPDVLMLQTIGLAMTANASGLGMAIGVWGETSSGGNWIGGIDNASPSVYRRASYTGAVLQSRQASDGAVGLQVSVVSVNEAGALLNFSTVPSPVNDVIYIALTAIPEVPPSTVTVRKIVEPSSDTTAFQMRVTGGAGPNYFQLSHGESRVFTVPAGTGYSLYETPVENYASTIEVSNLSPPSDISVAEGEQVVVTVRNVLLVQAPNTKVEYIRRVRQVAYLASENQDLLHDAFELHCQVGIGAVAGQGRDPQVSLSWSDDGGRTWSNEYPLSVGRLGDYSRAMAKWRKLGRSRDKGRLYRIVVTDPVDWALYDAFLDLRPGRR